MQSRRKRKTLILSILVVGLFVIWTVVPIYMLISQSVKPESIMFADPPKLFYQPIFDHFVRVFVRNDILGSMINSVIVSVSTMVLCVVLGALCAYSLARIRIPGSKFIAMFIILTRTVPAGALMMPMYVLMRELGLATSYLAVIFAHTALQLPFAVLMMKGFFQDVPLELEQAAQVDGCPECGLCEDLYSHDGPWCGYYRNHGAAELLERVYVRLNSHRQGNQNASHRYFVVFGRRFH